MDNSHRAACVAAQRFPAKSPGLYHHFWVPSTKPTFCLHYTYTHTYRRKPHTSKLHPAIVLSDFMQPNNHNHHVKPAYPSYKQLKHQSSMLEQTCTRAFHSTVVPPCTPTRHAWLTYISRDVIKRPSSHYFNTFASSPSVDICCTMSPPPTNSPFT